MIRYEPADAATDWAEVLDLLHRAFAAMEGRIDPPSSLHEMDAASLAAKAAQGTCLVAMDDQDVPLGCVFLEERENALNVSKLAVDPDRQGEGIGRALIGLTEQHARGRGLEALMLETRIELLENHLAFARMGFERTGETVHPGFDRPTSIIMEKPL